MSAPLISVIIPTKNRCTLLQETLASVQEQTYPLWEAIIVDDGSTDGTIEYLMNRCAQEPRIRFLQRAGEIAGANVCRNQGVAAARGEYVIFLDSDDLLATFCLEQRAAAMVAHPALDFAVFPSEVFKVVPGDVGRYQNIETPENDLDRYLKLDIAWQTSSPIWRRVAIAKIGPWDETLLSWQDWDFHVRALAQALSYQRFPMRDCFYRYDNSGRPTISRTMFFKEHLHRSEALLYKLRSLLHSKKLLTPSRQRLLAGIFIMLAVRWRQNDCDNEARDLIRRCRTSGVCGFREWDAWLYFDQHRCPGLWRISGLLHRRLFQRYQVLHPSPTQGTVTLTSSRILDG